MKKKTTKRIWGIILALCMLLALVPMVSFADEALYKRFDTYEIYYRIENGEAVIVGGAGDVEIPDTLDGCPVTTIAAEAFYANDYLYSISIPAGVTKIGENALSVTEALSKITVAANNPGFCTDSTGVLYTKDMTKLIRCPSQLIEGAYTVPNGVTEIGVRAFSMCYWITDITLPSSVKFIGNGAFQNCHSLTSINVPNGVPSIEAGTFFMCVRLTGVTIPDSVTEIGEKAFESCEELAGITIPDSVTKIGDEAFLCCKNLASLHIGSGVTHIGKAAFRGCEALTGVTIPGSVTSDGGYMFAFCPNLKDVTIEEGANNIGWGMFDSPALTSITIPDSMTEIPDFMFLGCSGLKTVYVGKNVARVGHEAFGSCDSLSAVYFSGDAPTLGTYPYDENVEQVFKTFVEGVSEDYYECFVPIPGLTLYYPEGAAGWTSPTWNGYPTAVSGAVQPSTPSTPSTPQQPVTPTAPMVGSFTDVRTDDWFAGAVEYAVNNGLFSGVSETSFAPNDGVTRAMLVTVLWRAAGEPPRSSDVSFFDINPFDWYGEAVRWAASENIVTGYGNGDFAPNDYITREQLAAIFQRYATFKGMATTERGDLSQFADAGSISGWANENVAWAVGAGLISGKGGGMLDPQGGATRAEVAVILQRFLEK